MNLDRFEQFKNDSDILIETSMWLTDQIDTIVREQRYYQDHPHLDTYDNMINRFNRMDELEGRSAVEDKIAQEHRIKYQDMYREGDDNDIC